MIPCMAYTSMQLIITSSTHMAKTRFTYTVCTRTRTVHVHMRGVTWNKKKTMYSVCSHWESSLDRVFLSSILQVGRPCWSGTKLASSAPASSSYWTPFCFPFLFFFLYLWVDKKTKQTAPCKEVNMYTHYLVILHIVHAVVYTQSLYKGERRQVG